MLDAGQALTVVAEHVEDSVDPVALSLEFPDEPVLYTFDLFEIA
ncbi:hypothetical protein [Candidatus Poriferisocius sp.]